MPTTQTFIIHSAINYVIRPDDDHSPALASLSTLTEVRAWGRERGLVLKRIAPGQTGRCHCFIPKG